MNLVDSRLSGNLVPDPDLLLLFDSATILNGYPPWQIRLTQIFRFSTLSEFHYSEFLESLAGFSKCEHRFGK